MITKKCPICETREYSKLIYPENLPGKNEAPNFAGRKNPDGYHYKMLRCKNCTLLYASEIYDEEYSNKLYHESTFDYSDELKSLQKSYSVALKQGIELLSEKKDNFLEIGCGNGFMLLEAKKLGFKNVKGIEPSINAISYADNTVRNFIVHDIFNEKKLEENKYDLVFVAMIIEHVTDANIFLSNIYKTLKKNGVVVCICHNERHLLSKILKNTHPIINDEHVAVFNKKALKMIFEKNKFVKINIEDLKNFYSINYWLKMIPIPKFIKNILSKIILLFFNKKIIGLRAGNLYLTAVKN